MLPDVFCHLFQLPGQTFAFVHLLGGGFGSVRLHLLWLLSACQLVLMTSGKPGQAGATRPGESKPSVGRRRNLEALTRTLNRVVPHTSPLGGLR